MPSYLFLPSSFLSITSQTPISSSFIPNFLLSCLISIFYNHLTTFFFFYSSSPVISSIFSSPSPSLSPSLIFHYSPPFPSSRFFHLIPSYSSSLINNLIIDDNTIISSIPSRLLQLIFFISSHSHRLISRLFHPIPSVPSSHSLHRKLSADDHVGKRIISNLANHLHGHLIDA